MSGRYDAAADEGDHSDAAGAARILRVRTPAAPGEGGCRRPWEGRTAARGDRGAHRIARQSWRWGRRHARLRGWRRYGGRLSRSWCGGACARHTSAGTGATPPTARGGRGPNFVFSVAADGLLRGIIPDTGDLALAPARFLPANATANSLIWADGSVYAATSNTCGGAPTAVYAMDFMAETKPVAMWESNGVAIVGLALGEDGTVYVSTGGGGSEYANSIVALEGKHEAVARVSTRTSPSSRRGRVHQRDRSLWRRRLRRAFT